MRGDARIAEPIGGVTLLREGGADLSTDPPPASRWRRKRPETSPPMNDRADPSEAHAVAASRQGDLAAWEYVTRRQQETVFRSAYLVTRDSLAAEETTKIVFTRAYRSLHSLDVDTGLKPWLMAMAGSAARTYLRDIAQRRDARVPDPDPCPRYVATPIDLGQGARRPTPAAHEALVDAFEGMLDDDRFAIAARYAFDLGQNDAAVRLGIAPDEVEQRVVSSMRRLRVRVAEIMARNATPDLVGPAGARPVTPVDRFASIADDQLGSVTMAAVLSELPWTPDVAPVVCSQLARQGLAYPEQRSVAVTAPGLDAGQRPGSGSTSRSGSQRPVRRSHGMSSMRVVGLTAGLALVAVSFAVGGGAAGGDQRLEIPADVGSGIAALLGQGEAGPAADQSSGASVVQRPPAPGEAASATEAASLPLTQQAAQAPQLAIIGARRFDNGKLGARISIGWASADRAGPVGKTRLERKIGRGKWRAFAWSDSEASTVAAMRPGKTYRFRLRSVDEAGAEVLSPVARVVLSSRGPRSQRLMLLEG